MHGGLRGYTVSITRRRSIRDVQMNRRYGALCVVRDQCLLQVINFAQLAGSNARGEERLDAESDATRH